MPPKKNKRGAPWAAINARKEQLERARVHKELQAQRAAAEAARGDAPSMVPDVQHAPMPPPPSPMDWEAGPASGTRANRMGIHIFATSSGAMYGVGEDMESARAEITAQHEKRQAEAAAVALQKLSQDDSYNNSPPEVVAAMDRQRKRQGGIFMPVSFLPPSTQGANEMAHPGTPYVLSTPPPARNTSSTMGSFTGASTSSGLPMFPSSGRARRPIHQPQFRDLTPPRIDEESRPAPSTPRPTYYTNPHHGPSRYGGWFEHNQRTSNDAYPSTPQRVLEPQTQTVWPQMKPRQPGLSSERDPLMTPTKKSKHAPPEDDDDDGSEWCAAPVPKSNQQDETDVGKRVVAHVDVVRNQPDSVRLSNSPIVSNASLSVKSKRKAMDDMDKDINDTVHKKHRSGTPSYSTNSFANDILYARELFSGS
ncbi:hypothetical protein SLS58_006431 [Diplodia intermedia]|uniref:Uncharacterized protein n=1 Tax=Diplodia intermedia TaxID=856260 RepID=A0ABR3TMY0_9PEZI